MRTRTLAGVTLILLFSLALGAAWAGTRDEAVLTVQVSSAEHEVVEGYFTLGDNTTIMAKPGSDLYKFLSRQRGRTIKITLTEAGKPGLSTLER
ncbi:hypothetical protein BH24ACI4_BH24ACI4_29790 [soil metagenome]